MQEILSNQTLGTDYSYRPSNIQCSLGMTYSLWQNFMRLRNVRTWCTLTIDARGRGNSFNIGDSYIAKLFNFEFHYRESANYLSVSLTLNDWNIQKAVGRKTSLTQGGSLDIINFSINSAKLETILKYRFRISKKFKNRSFSEIINFQSFERRVCSF